MAEAVHEFFHQRRALRDFVRCARCVLMSEPGIEAHQVARRLYGDKLDPRIVQRAAVDPVDTGTASELIGGGPSAAFADAVRPLTVLGRLQGTIPVPFRVTFPFIDAATEFDFRGESQPIAVTLAGFDTPISLERNRISGIIVTSNELLQHGAMAEAVLGRDMIRGTVQATDKRLLDPTSDAIPRVRPASITFNAVEIDATGAAGAADVDGVVGDLVTAIQLAGSTPERATLITTPANSIALGLMRDSSGSRAFPGVGVRGGSIADMPLLTSDSCPADTLIIVDAGQLLVADDGEAQVVRSENASIEMDDSPAGGATVSMFMTDSSGIKVNRWLSWRMLRPFVAIATAFAPPIPTTVSA